MLRARRYFRIHTRFLAFGQYVPLTPEAMTRIQQRRRRDHFNQWRKRTNVGIRALTNRVFNLRHQPYMGSGFHYSMECRLGHVLILLNDYERRFNTSDEIMAEIAVEELYREVVLAERSLVVGSTV